MKVIHFEDANAFYERVEPYLLPHEAEHNLIFGLLSNIRHSAARFPDALLTTVEDQGALQLVALRTDPEHNLILSKTESPEAIPLLANDLFAAGVVLAGANGMTEESRRFVEAWAGLSGCRYRINMPMRTFKLEKVNPVSGVSGQLRRAEAKDRDLLVQWELAFAREEFAEQEHTLEGAQGAVDANLVSDTAGIYVWDNGGVVVSYAAYKGPTPHGIRIGPVYTPPELRGHGYASACVAGMSQYLIDSGRQFCFLFTDLRNPTSNHIYQVIGYRPVCDFMEYRFAD